MAGQSTSDVVSPVGVSAAVSRVVKDAKWKLRDCSGKDVGDLHITAVHDYKADGVVTLETEEPEVDAAPARVVGHGESVAEEPARARGLQLIGRSAHERTAACSGRSRRRAAVSYPPC